MELDIPADMPDDLKEIANVSLLFKTSSNDNVQIFDKSKALVTITDLSTAQSLKLPDEGEGDKPPIGLIETGSATIYIEGLGSSKGGENDARRWVTMLIKFHFA